MQTSRRDTVFPLVHIQHTTREKEKATHELTNTQGEEGR